MTAASDIVVCDVGNDRLAVFTWDGAWKRSVGGRGSAEGQFQYPRFVAVDGAGHLLVSDEDNHRVQEFDAAYGFVRSLGRAGSGAGELNQPNGVAVDAAGNVAVAEAGNHRVQVCDKVFARAAVGVQQVIYICTYIHIYLIYI